VARRGPSGGRVHDERWLGLVVFGLVVFAVGVYSPAFLWVPQPKGAPAPGGFTLRTIVQSTVAVVGAALAVLGYVYYTEGRVAPAPRSGEPSDLRSRGKRIAPSFEVYDPRGDSPRRRR
jgi:hypothetical protein